MILVNCGCGETFHPDWVNLDAAPCMPAVRRWDVRRRLPFADASVDAVYHSHLLEHLDAAEAKSFLRECRRVLRSDGTLRVAVPDLEGIAAAYLSELDVAARGGDSTRYDWCRLELIDQAARTVSGGEMAALARSLTAEQRALVRARAGRELDGMLQPSPAGGRWRRLTPGKAWWRARRELLRVVAWLIGGRRVRAMFDEGCFRQSGEVHRAMYDRVSLARVLVECGFVRPVKVAAAESRIPGFARYGLEIVDGAVRKPDSLFMEAVRP